MNTIVLEKSEIPSEVIEYIKSHFDNVNFDTYGNKLTRECISRTVVVECFDHACVLRCNILRHDIKPDSVDVYEISKIKQHLEL